MEQVISLSAAKAHLAGLVQAAETGEVGHISRHGKPVAVLMSPDEYDSWRENQEIKRDPDLMRQIRQSIKAFEKGEVKECDLDELFGKRP